MRFSTEELEKFQEWYDKGHLRLVPIATATDRRLSEKLSRLINKTSITNTCPCIRQDHTIASGQ